MSDLKIMERGMSMVGLKSPTTRFLGIMVVTNGIIFYSRPKYWFNQVTLEPEPNAIVPWWTVGLLTGAIAAFFL